MSIGRLTGRSARSIVRPAARLSGLQGSLLGLPQPGLSLLSQSRRAGRTGLHDGAGRGAGGGKQGAGRAGRQWSTSSTTTASCDAPGAALGSFRQAVPKRKGGERREQWRPAARSVIDRKGARGRADIHLLASISGFEDTAETGRPSCLGETPGMHYNPYFGLRRPARELQGSQDRQWRSSMAAYGDAAAADARPRDLCRWHPGNDRSDGQGCRHVPRLGERSASGRAQEDGLRGDDLSLHPRRLLVVAYRKVWVDVEH